MDKAHPRYAAFFIRSSTGFGYIPKRRGEWHSYQIMVIPSDRDPKVGYQKVWVDGELAVAYKAATRQDYDYFWLSNYWHSLEYSTKKANLHRVFEEHTAPPHPAFDIQFDNLIVSKSFIEFDQNKAQIERVRFSDLKPDSMTVHFHTTVPARSITATWQADGAPAVSAEMDVADSELGYFHSMPIASLKPGTRYTLKLAAVDRHGRTLAIDAPGFTTGKDVAADFDMPSWKGEVFTGHGFEGAPTMVKNFDSLNHVGWTGHDTDDIIDTTQPMCVRYTKTQHFDAGTYTFRVAAYDGIRVKVDGETKVDAVGKTQGAKRRRDFNIALTEGDHEIVVEHTIWREGWDTIARKYLCFLIEPEDKTPPELLAHAIYDTRFHERGQPKYCGRWTEYVDVTVEYGETDAYGRSATGRGRYPYVDLGELEIGKTYHWRVTAVDLMGNRTVTPDATFVCGDTIPPGKILMRVQDVTDTSATLSFRARGEDGAYGQLTAYDIRWSTEPITIHNWDEANRMANPPAPGTPWANEQIVVDGLPAGEKWYFAVKGIDQSGHESLLSNVVSSTHDMDAVMDLDGDGYGFGSPLGNDPDDYDPMVPRPSSDP